jgi:threonine/homoserine/homoserine lactone efflux protein
MRNWRIGVRLSNQRRMEIVLKGIVSGVVLAFLIGPVFFTILQTSIERGFRSGAWVAVGVSFSDAIYILISYLGLYQFFENPTSRLYLAYVGGGILFVFGAYYLFIKSRKLQAYHPEHIKYRSPFRLMAKGFLINGLSPMVLIFWIGTVGLATTEFGYTKHWQAATYFSAIVGTVFITDLLKAKLADRLRLAMTTNTIRRLNVVLGIVLIIFGVRLIVFADQLI